MALTDERVRKVLESRDEERLINLVFDESIDPKERPTAVRRALWELDEIDYEEIAELCVRACIELPEKVCREIRNWFLGKWIEGSGYYQRKNVLSLLAERLDTESEGRLVNAIRAIQFIGYREGPIVERLERLSGIVGEHSSDDNVEAWALTALARLGYPDGEKITKRLRDRLKRNRKLNEADCWTAFYHADRNMMVALFRSISWQKPALEAIAKLVEREPSLGEEAWRRYVAKDDPERWLYKGRMAEAIDRPEVGEALADQALEAMRDHESTNVLVPRSRLIDAYRPNVIDGAKARGRRITPREIGWLRTLAVQPDESNIRFRTAEGYDKDAAWKVLLHLGRQEAREWLARALGENPSSSDMIYARYAGYLQVGEVVPALANCIKAEDTDLGHGLRAIEALGVIGTQEALLALLENEVWFDGKAKGGIPKDLVGAIVSTCITLKSDAIVWDALTDTARHRVVRETCAYALEELSQYPNAPAPRISEIHSLLSGDYESQPGWEQLLTIRGEFVSHPETLRLLERIAEEHPNSKDVTEALARSGLLSKYPQRLRELGLHRTEGDWRAPDPLDRFQTFILLLLYKGDPLFEKAMIDVLDTASYNTASQILYNLHPGDEVSGALADSLFDRLVEDKGGYYGGAGTVHAIGNVAPNLLVAERLVQILARWDAKLVAEYLEQLRESSDRIVGQDALWEIGTRYLRDEDSGVRRSSGRLLRTISPQKLGKAVSKMIQGAEALEDWIYAAQSARYMDEPPPEAISLRDAHPEPLVRKAFRQAIDEIERAGLARSYISQLLSNIDLLPVWAYSHALLKIGDEDSAQELLDALPEEVNRRAFLIQLAEDISKEGKKRREKLDDELTLPPGPNRETEVVVYFEELSGAPFKAKLRERSGARGRGRFSALWFLEFSEVPEPLKSQDSLRNVRILLEDERRGNAAVVRRVSTNRKEEGLLMIGRGHMS